MNSYISEWNKETVMTHATRLLHITQELSGDAVPKYTKKHYASLGFGSSSLMALKEEDELALVQEAYNIAWTYLNLTLEYTPIARTDLKLHTHHGALGNFTGTLMQEGSVLIGDDQGVYTCSTSNSITWRWYRPSSAIIQPQPNRTEAYTGRVITGTRTSAIKSGKPTDLNAMSDAELMSVEEPICIRLSPDYWWLTWYPKQQYMMIHKSEYSNHYCQYPSDVTWSYRVAPSSYRHFVIPNSQGWTTDRPLTSSTTADFKTNLPLERHQTDYAYEVRNDLGKFEWVEIKGTLPVYKCPPMVVKYFNDSFPNVLFEGDNSLEENNKYSEILDSIEDPRNVSGYVVWESAVTRTTMYYLQAEFYAIPLRELFPIRQSALYTNRYKFPEPRPHSSGEKLPEADNSPNWVYVSEDHPYIALSYSFPPRKAYIGDGEYKLYALINPARNASGLVMYPEFDAFLSTTGTDTFDDRSGFFLEHTTMLGVRYTPDGEAYAICVVESSNVRSWTHPYGDYANKYPLTAQVIKQEVSGVDWFPLNKLIQYKTVPSREFVAPNLDMPNYRFKVQLARRPYYNASGAQATSGKESVEARFREPKEEVSLPAHRFWAFGDESAQYQYMLNTRTGDSGFYKPDLPVDTYTFKSTKELFDGS